MPVFEELHGFIDSKMRIKYLYIYLDCSAGSVGYQGLCIDCGRGCSDCQVNNSQSRLIVCTSCSQGYILNQGKCDQSCGGNCMRCSGQVCIACQPFSTLLNNICIRTIIIIQLTVRLELP